MTSRSGSGRLGVGSASPRASATSAALLLALAERRRLGSRDEAVLGGRLRHLRREPGRGLGFLRESSVASGRLGGGAFSGFAAAVSAAAAAAASAAAMAARRAISASSAARRSAAAAAPTAAASFMDAWSSGGGSPCIQTRLLVIAEVAPREAGRLGERLADHSRARPGGRTPRRTSPSSSNRS